MFKYKKYKCGLGIVVAMLFCITSFCQSNNEGKIPSVFMIGQHESAFENIVADHQLLLLTVCQNSMDVAYESWLDLMAAIEVYATERNVDLKGCKIWLNVFWDKDGSIDHMVFYPKPHSKNMDFDILTDLFIGFIHEYTFDKVSTEKYSHYGSASFPVFRPSLNTSEN
jgi:hypothetical protein